MCNRPIVGAYSLLGRLEDVVVDNLALGFDLAHQIVTVFVKPGMKTTYFFIFTLD